MAIRKVAAPRTADAEVQQIGRNVAYHVEGTKLIIEVDLSARLGPSSSGKTIIVATSEGNKEVAPGISMGLNIYTKK